MSSSRRWLILLALGGLSATIGFGAWQWNHRASEQVNPSSGNLAVSTSTAEFHDLDDNTSPKIAGLETCSGCHRTQADAFRTSGHSRTFLHSSQSAEARSLHGKTFDDPERGYSFRFHFEPEKGLSVSIPGKFDRPLPLQYVLGSGAHATSFVGLRAGARAGDPTIGVEHRVSLGTKNHERFLKVTFGQLGRPADSELSHFGVVLDPPTLQACVDCHVTSGKVSQTSVIDLRKDVTCECCHGPGSKHVAAAERGVDHPGHLRFAPGSYTPDQQVELCGRCHRVAEMCPVETIGRNKVSLTRFQPVGMKLSRCFKESDGGMNCVTCHDPHRGVEHDAAAYVSKCLKCHSKAHPETTSCPISQTEGCIKCHMPAVPWLHGAFTDHWIRVRDERDPEPPYSIPKPQKRRD